MDGAELGAHVRCPHCANSLRLPRTNFETGTELAGYRIEKVLGSGGMGDIFLATQLSMARTVALKVLPPQVIGDDRKAIDQFLNEVRMTAKFEHSNLVTVFEAGEADGYYYLAMSYIDGEDLDIALDKRTRFAEAEALEIAGKVAGALGYAWDRGRMLHRDIKPSNIMLTRRGEVKLMDLGIARSLKEPPAGDTRVDLVLGTPFYMSPEQATGRQNLDCRSDIYSLGATVFHLLSGSPPFTASSPAEIMIQHVKAEVPSIRALTPDVSEGTDALLRRMMAKTPEERFSGWDELLGAIARLQPGSAPPEEPPAAAAPSGKSTKPKAAAKGGQVRKGRPRAAPKGAGVRLPPKPQPKITPRKGRPASPAPKLRAPTRPPQAATVPVIAGHTELAMDPPAPPSSAPLVLVLVLVILGVAGGGLWFAHQNGMLQAALQQTGAATDQEAEDGDPELDARVAAVRAGLAEVDASYRRNPDGFAAIEGQLAVLRDVAGETPAAPLVDQTITRYAGLKQERIDGVVASLERQAAVHIAAEQFAEAAALFSDYNGPWEPETRAAREALAGPLHERAETKRLREQTATADAWLAEALERLARGEWESLALSLEELAATVVEAELAPETRELLTELRAVAAMPGQALAAFAESRGKKITVQLKTGPETVTVQSVDAEAVTTHRILKNGGTITIVITPERLASDALSDRLAGRDEPAAAIMRAILAVRVGAAAEARAMLEAAATPLAQALAGLVEIPEDAEALARVLNMVRVGPEQFQRNAPPRRPPGLDDEALVKFEMAVRDYRRDYAHLPAAVRRAEVMESWLVRWVMRDDAPPNDNADEPEPITGDPVARFFERLSALNAGYTRDGDRLARVQTGDDGAVVALSFLAARAPRVPPLKPYFPQLKTLLLGPPRQPDAGIPQRSPLAGLDFVRGLKLVQLRCTDAHVRSLEPLAGMPLERLWISGCLVADPGPLAGAPLEQLDLRFNPVEQVNALGSARLQILNLDHTRVRTLVPLAAGRNRLQQLSCVHTPLESLAGLAEMPLVRLDIRETEVRDFGPLRNLPLQWLAAEKCPIRSFGSLVGLPLKHLDLSHTPLRTWEPLTGLRTSALRVRGCPLETLEGVPVAGLETLDVAETRVRSLEPLRGASALRSLDISATKVSDLAPLSRSKLQVLLAGNTEITDLTPLESVPIRVLDMSATRLRDISVLSQMKVERLNIRLTGVTDLTPLGNTPLVALDYAGYRASRDDPVLSLIQEFRLLNGRPYRRSGRRPK